MLYSKNVMFVIEDRWSRFKSLCDALHHGLSRRLASKILGRKYISAVPVKEDDIRMLKRVVVELGKGVPVDSIASSLGITPSKVRLWSVAYNNLTFKGTKEFTFHTRAEYKKAGILPGPLFKSAFTKFIHAFMKNPTPSAYCKSDMGIIMAAVSRIQAGKDIWDEEIVEPVWTINPACVPVDDEEPSGIVYV